MTIDADERQEKEEFVLYQEGKLEAKAIRLSFLPPIGAHLKVPGRYTEEDTDGTFEVLDHEWILQQPDDENLAPLLQVIIHIGRINLNSPDGVGKF